MKKRTFLRALTAVVAGAGALSPFLPTTGDASNPLVLVALGVLALKEVGVIIGDYLDDGVRNDSFVGK